MNVLFNVFDSTNDLEYLIQQAGKDVYINDVQRKALISNLSIGAMSENDDRFISTLDSINRGNLVRLNNRNFLIITETVVKRYDKYKGIMRHCNFTITFTEVLEEECVYVGEDGTGIPQYKCTPTVTEVTDIPLIVDTKSFSIDRNSTFLLATNEITVVSQDNPFNKEKFKVNYRFNLMGAEWKIINVDLTKNGLLVMTCEKVT